jgi:hypothetical protein
MASFDDGSGPAIYAAGGFTSSGSISVNRVAKLIGEEWSPLGDGIGDGVVNALAVYDDGTGPALYAGGTFTLAGGAPASCIAKWNGTQWSSVGEGFNGTVTCLRVHSDESGSHLYAGGSFTASGASHVNRLAKWNGAEWEALGQGVDNGDVYALAVYDDGAGPALYAGGTFTLAGGAPASCIAKWNGKVWSPLGSGLLSGTVRALAVFDYGDGPVLCIGGSFSEVGGVRTSGVAAWDGASWCAIAQSGQGQQFGVNVFSLVVHDDGSGPSLLVGNTGANWPLGTGYRNHVVKWDGVNVSWLSWGIGPANSLGLSVNALCGHNELAGPALYVGGTFTTIGELRANGIARWDGARWGSLGDGVRRSSGSGGFVNSMATFDDGTGPALYVGGEFDTAGGVPSANIAIWNGAHWSALSGGAPGIGVVRAMTVYNDGSGPALYVAGSGVARWNGANWSSLGSGVGGVVYALAVYDDGTGPALYAGGTFTSAGGVPANRIAKWDGKQWSPLGSGVNNWVRALAVYDDGSGSALYVGGEFATAGGMTVNHIAKWNGTQWFALGEGVSNDVHALAAFDDGLGPKLYVCGSFTEAGSTPVSRIARWSGTEWSSLGAGLDVSGGVSALAVFSDGESPGLYVGGSFTRSPSTDSHLAKWGCVDR